MSLANEPVLSGSDVGLFASDMHLGDHDPATAAMFCERLDAAWPQASHLFLLGDLFEAWVGDDQPDVAARDLAALCARISASGRSLYVMRGNRDFLLDTGAGELRFTGRTGSVLLDDPCAALLFGERVVLAHGDALCTDDVDYQRVRAQVRTDAWRDGFLSRALDERLAIARQLRAESERAQASRYPSDVGREAVDSALRAAGASAMIHGHTHRPGCHEWQLDGRAVRRWVLPDWDAAEGRGGFLRVTAAGYSQIGY